MTSLRRIPTPGTRRSRALATQEEARPAKHATDKRAPTLIVMARAPRIGAGKQRLAKEAGRVEAWRINRALQAKTLRAAKDPRWMTLLCVTPDAARRLTLPGVWPVGVPRIAQGAGDLGARLARAVKGRRRVAIIGADAPLLTRALIAAAFRALARARFAVGPAHDGGFWILAARRGDAAARAMRGVRWSAPETLDDVLARLPACPALLPALRDVDTLADWRSVHGLDRFPKRLPRT
jgi:glycosyltransferase A (GT-A) superfamily protein (DUF2064 family)